MNFAKLNINNYDVNLSKALKLTDSIVEYQNVPGGAPGPPASREGDGKISIPHCVYQIVSTLMLAYTCFKRAHTYCASAVLWRY